MAVVYGYDVASHDDPFMKAAEAVMEKTGDLLVSTGSFVLNAFPLFRFIPSWFPGAGFKRKAFQGRDDVNMMYDLPFRMVEKKMEAGNASSCIVSNLLEKNPSEEEYSVIKGMATSAYAAGTDTMGSTLGVFFYLMLLHPIIQAKAQQELDSRIKPDRLPTLEDQESLPYISALLKEVLRWMPITPLGVLHRLTEDDVYNSYYIPKGAIVMSNIWAINRDHELYPNPEKFTPERFLNENGTLRSDREINIISFGFGRRICPGRYMALEVLWLAMATILHTFNIRPKKDASGNDIIPDVKYTDGALVRPLPFDCTITPRTPISDRLIRTANSKTKDR